MSGSRPRVRRTGALTRTTVRRVNRRTPPAVESVGRDRLRYLRSPATWLAGVLVAVATVTFQDALTSTVKAILPVDSLPDWVSTQDPVEVVEAKNVKENGEYLVRGGRQAHLGRELNSGEWREHQEGVVDVGTAEWMVTLRGAATQQVRITDIVPEVEGGKCSAPLTGSLVYAPSQGETDVIPLHVTVDDPVPRLKVYKDGKATAPYFTGPRAKQITLEQDESEAVYIVATARHDYCRWHYRIHYQVGERSAEQVFRRPDGKPFELTGKLADVSGYNTVHFPSFICPGGNTRSRQWLSGTGEEYARALKKRHEVPCTPDSPSR